jgi:putative transposase
MVELLRTCYQAQPVLVYGSYGDELFDGRRLRLLTIVDNFSRVSPCIGIGFSYKGDDVVSALNLAVAQYGVP